MGGGSAGILQAGTTEEKGSNARLVSLKKNSFLFLIERKKKRGSEGDRSRTETPLFFLLLLNLSTPLPHKSKKT